MKKNAFAVVAMLMVAALANAADDSAPDSTSGSASWKLAGNGALMMRAYAEPDVEGRESDRAGLRLSPEWTFKDGTTSLMIAPRLYAEGEDSGRSRADFNELYASSRVGEATVKVGLSRVFWGVTESRHLEDIINPPDLAVQYTGDVRLATAMVHYTQPTDFGAVELLLLPWERDPRYPGVVGRPRTALPVSDEMSHPDGKPVAFAARVGVSKGGFDAHAYFFRGLDRESVLAPHIEPMAAPTEFIATRTLIRQWGFDFQMPVGNWLLKSEMIRRSGYSRSFNAGVLGTEYALNGIGGSVVDVTLMGEAQFDTRPDDAPLAPMQHAVFGGVRVALNDPASTEFKSGLVRDATSNARVWRGDFSRRIADNWTIEASLNAFSHVTKAPALVGFKQDSYIEMQLKRHF